LKIIFVLEKNIDFVFFGENKPNMYQYELNTENGMKTTIDLFKDKFFLFQKPTPKIENSYFNKKFKLYQFKKDFIYNRILNSILPIKRTILLDYFSVKNENSYDKLLKTLLNFKIKFSFNSYPLTIYSENLINYYLSVNNGLSTKFKLNYLKKLKYSTIYLLIYRQINNHFATKIIYNYFLNNSIKYNKRFKNPNFLYITLLIILPFIIKIIEEKKEINKKELDELLEDYIKYKMNFINLLKIK